MKAQKCIECGETMKSKVSTKAAPYHFVESGLKRAFIVGLETHRCAGCGAEEVEIPALGRLHAMIAKRLIARDGILAGDEIRFLRKHAGFSGREFARLAGVTPEHLSRVENEKAAAGVPLSRMSQVVAAARLDDTDTYSAMKSMAKSLHQNPSLRKHWKAIATRGARSGWKVELKAVRPRARAGVGTKAHPRRAVGD